MAKGSKKCESKPRDTKSEGKATKRNSESGADNNNSGSPGDESAPKNSRTSKTSVVLKSPIKSTSDKKSYRLIRLANGLRCLLISDDIQNDNPIWAQNSYNEGIKRLKKTGYCNSFACEKFPSIWKQKIKIVSTSSLEGESKSNVEKEGYRCISSLDGVTLSGLLNQQPQLDFNMSSMVKGEDEAAFCLIVQAGGADDPQTGHGMAHFVEHMLHYGSEKYPGEGKYCNLMQQFGNHGNAYTQMHSTAYQCSIHPGFLPNAIDVFSNIVTYPAFDANCAKREVNAVDSEDILTKDRMIIKIFEILRTTVPNDHPMKSYFGGNATTLRGNLKQQLHSFHKANYVGKKMTFAIQSTHNLDFLQDLVESYMTSIPAGEEVKEPERENMNPYKIDDFRKLYKLEGEPRLAIFWQFPAEVWKNFEARPLEVFEVVMNDGRAGGLQHYLFQKGWITYFNSGSQKVDDCQNKYVTFYLLFISLTIEGEKHVDQVVRSVLAYVDVIVKAPVEQKQRVWEELRQAAKAKFDYIGDGTPLNNTHYAARTLISSTTGEDIFTSQLLFQEEFDDKIFNSVVKEIVPENALYLWVVSKLTGKTKEMEHTNVLYTVSDIPKNFLSVAKIDSLRFPGENPFMTTRFHIEKFSEPYKVIKPKMTLEYKTIKGLTIPKAYLEILFVSTEGCRSPHERSMLTMLSSHILMSMWGEVICASRAGLTSSIDSFTQDSDISALQFEALGFTEFMPEIIKSFCHGFSKPSCAGISDKEFEQLKQEEITHYNMQLSNNVDLLSILWQRVIVVDYVNEIDTPFSPRNLKKADFQMFISKFRSSMQIFSRLEGNFSKDQVKYIEATLDKVEYENLSNVSMDDPAILCLQEGERAIRIRLKDTDYIGNENNAVLNMYQVASNGIRDDAIVKVVANLFNGKVFQILRTREQLGYHLGSIPPQENQLISFTIYIVTPRNKHTSCYVSSRIDNFLGIFYEEYLTKMTEKEYEDALLKVHLDTSHISLEEVQSWYLQNITKCLPSKANENKFVGLRKLSLQVVSSAKKNVHCPAKQCTNKCPVCRNITWVPSGNPLLEFARINPCAGRSKNTPPSNYFIYDISEYHNEIFR